MFKNSLLFSCFLLLLSSCNKDLSNDDKATLKNNNSKHVELFPTIKHPQDLANSRSSNDTSAVAMVLGTTYNNPYLIPNMRQAYLNIFGSLPPCDLPVTDLYIKWTPNSW